MSARNTLEIVADKSRAVFEKARTGLVSGKLTVYLIKRVGTSSLGRTAAAAFGLQAALLLIIGIASIGSISSALGDVSDLNGVVRQQRLLLAARIATIEAGDKVRAYALDPSEKTEAAARKAVEASSDAVEQASRAALTSEQSETLAVARDIAVTGPKDFERLVQNRGAIAKIVEDQIYVEGAAIQQDLNRLSEHASAMGENGAAGKAREAGAAYALVRIAFERFLTSSSQKNVEAAKQQSLALEDVLNQLYDSTKDPTILAEADGVIKRLIRFDDSFQKIIKLTTARDSLLHELLERHGTKVAQAVDEVGGQVDSIQSSAAGSARLKLGGLLSLSLLISSVGILFLFVASIVFNRAVTRPIVAITGDMKKLAQGELDHEAKFTARHDELGEMARAMEVFRLNAIEVRRLQSEEAERLEAKRRADQLAHDAERRAIEERQRAQAEAEQAKREMLANLASRFQNQVANTVNTLAEKAREIDAGAQRVAAAVSSSRTVAASVTDAAVEATTSTTTIAAAAEELTLSLGEVSKQVTESSNCAARAVDRVGQTDEIVTSLARDAAEIGEVVSLVHNIAQQVNLLALNATIEASRAGEAGRGFAVVAAEVKSLAQQTAAATTKIGERVGSIQNVSKTAMQAIDEIGEVISEMGVLATSVAIAVEQQVSTTAEIARNTTLAASSAGHFTNNLKRVQDGVSVSGEAADMARVAAAEVSRQTEALQAEIDSFLASVRAA